MIAMMQQVAELALRRLFETVTTFVPPLLAGATILLIAYLSACLVRWLVNRVFKGIAVDHFLARSGISSLLGLSGRLRATRLVSTTLYWFTLGVGALAALNVFDTQLTTRMVESAVFALPKLVTAGALLLAGAWLAQYLGRSALVWASNEGLSHCRRLAAGVRLGVMFIAVVVVADQLDFARNVFLAAFIVLAGGVAIAVSIAVGLAARTAALRCFEKPSAEDSPEKDRTLWNHL